MANASAAIPRHRGLCPGRNLSACEDGDSGPGNQQGQRLREPRKQARHKTVLTNRTSKSPKISCNARASTQDIQRGFLVLRCGRLKGHSLRLQNPDAIDQAECRPFQFFSAAAVRTAARNVAVDRVLSAATGTREELSVNGEARNCPVRLAATRRLRRNGRDPVRIASCQSRKVPKLLFEIAGSVEPVRQSKTIAVNTKTLPGSQYQPMTFGCAMNNTSIDTNGAR